MSELLSTPEEWALVRSLPGRDRTARSTVMRARRDPRHPAHPLPGGGYTDPRTTSEIEGMAVVIRAPKDAILAFWEPRRPGPAPAAEPQEADRG